MNNLIVITTRDYPLKKREGYSFCEIPEMDDLFKSIDLDDPDTISPIQSLLDYNPGAIKEYPEVVRRILVWDDDRASWCRDSDFFDGVKGNGFNLVKIHLESDDACFYVYVGPCTNGGMNLSFRRRYTATILKTAALHKVESWDRIVLVAHDKDLVDEPGSGLVTQPIFDGLLSADVIRVLKVLKFQHEDSDPIWKAFVAPINSADGITFERCIGFLDKIDAMKDQDVDLSLYCRQDTITTSYMNLLKT